MALPGADRENVTATSGTSHTTRLRAAVANNPTAAFLYLEYEGVWRVSSARTLAASKDGGDGFYELVTLDHRWTREYWKIDREFQVGRSGSRV